MMEMAKGTSTAEWNIENPRIWQKCVGRILKKGEKMQKKKKRKNPTKILSEPCPIAFHLTTSISCWIRYTAHLRLKSQHGTFFPCYCFTFGIILTRASILFEFIQSHISNGATSYISLLLISLSLSLPHPRHSFIFGCCWEKSDLLMNFTQRIFSYFPPKNANWIPK